MRKKIVAGNWKMNLTFDAADELLQNIMDRLEEITLPQGTLLIVCPPYPYLEMASEYGSDSYFATGAQDVSTHDDGAYTGDISADMLKSLEIEYCIVGHSERRQYHGETNAQIAQKTNQLHSRHITPIVCVGENLQEREAGTHTQVIRTQVEECLFHLTPDQIRNTIIAYEPIWAIGTGRTATPQQAQEIHAHIRALLTHHYGADVANDISILYGGSCKPANARELFANPDVDGGLIGGASLKADDFINIALAF